MKYMADMVSLFRILCVAPLLYFAFTSEWKLAFATIIIAWASDLLDGVMARRFGSLRNSNPDFDADGIADSVLAFSSSVVPVIYIIHANGWGLGGILAGLWLLTVISGVAMISVMGKPITQETRLLVAGNMLIMHGIVQIAGTLAWFGYMAFDVIGVLAVGITMLPVAYAQRHKMALWTAGKFE